MTALRLLWLLVTAPARWVRFEWRLLNDVTGPYLGPPELWLDEPRDEVSS